MYRQVKKLLPNKFSRNLLGRRGHFSSTKLSIATHFYIVRNFIELNLLTGCHTFSNCQCWEFSGTSRQYPIVDHFRYSRYLLVDVYGYCKEEWHVHHSSPGNKKFKWTEHICITPELKSPNFVSFALSWNLSVILKEITVTARILPASKCASKT